MAAKRWPTQRPLAKRPPASKCCAFSGVLGQLEPNSANQARVASDSGRAWLSHPLKRAEIWPTSGRSSAPEVALEELSSYCFGNLGARRERRGGGLNPGNAWRALVRQRLGNLILSAIIGHGGGPGHDGMNEAYETGHSGTRACHDAGHMRRRRQAGGDGGMSAGHGSGHALANVAGCRS